MTATGQMSDSTRSPHPCRFTGLVCAAETSTTNAYFADTNSGVPVAGTCISGYTAGTVPPSRTCLVTGVWSADVGGCTRMHGCCASRM